MPKIINLKKEKYSFQIDEETSNLLKEIKELEKTKKIEVDFSEDLNSFLKKTLKKTIKDLTEKEVKNEL